MERAVFRQAKEFAFRDVRREISLAYACEQDSGKAMIAQAGIELGGGNFLTALGLFCYTEFGGKLKYNCRRNGSDHASENFNRFFDDIGQAYKTFRETRRQAGHSIYDIFRCGLAHEYYVKHSCKIAMMGTDKPVGIWYSDGRYYFLVERYCQDLERAFGDLERHLYPDKP